MGRLAQKISKNTYSRFFKQRGGVIIEQSGGVFTLPVYKSRVVRRMYGGFKFRLGPIIKTFKEKAKTFGQKALRAGKRIGREVGKDAIITAITAAPDVIRGAKNVGDVVRENKGRLVKKMGHIAQEEFQKGGVYHVNRKTKLRVKEPNVFGE